MASFIKQLKNVSKYSSEELSLRAIPNEVKTFIDQLYARAKRLSEASEAVNEINRVAVLKTEKDVLKERIDDHTHDYADDDDIDSIYNKLNNLFSTEGLTLMDSNMCRAPQGHLLDEASKLVSIALIAQRLNKSINFITARIKYFRLTKKFPQIVF